MCKAASYDNFVIRVKFLQTVGKNEEIIIICKTYGFAVMLLVSQKIYFTRTVCATRTIRYIKVCAFNMTLYN